MIQNLFFNETFYKSCPEGTLYSFNISYLCQDIKELEKYNSQSIIFEKDLNLANNEISEESINSLTREYLSYVCNMSYIVSKIENENLKVYIYKNSSSLEDTAEEAPKNRFW